MAKGKTNKPKIAKSDTSYIESDPLRRGKSHYCNFDLTSLDAFAKIFEFLTPFEIFSMKVVCKAVFI
jgi:hypothetical protein